MWYSSSVLLLTLIFDIGDMAFKTINSVLVSTFFLALIAMTCLLGTTSTAHANKKYASIVMDADTGVILSQSNADKKLHPASLTKIMTLVMVFDALEGGKIDLNDRITISRKAASMVPSKLGLPAGSSIRVKDAIYALVTKSANDIAVAVAEHIGGSERNFARLMTAKARAIGMNSTTFVNASGLHDRRQISTARDMAKLGRYSVYRYPRQYKYFSTARFKYRGKTYKNHNKLLGHYNGVDGIKTGYINASGFNLVASAERNGRRIIGVVFGGRSSKTRNDHMVTLLDRGFARVGDIQIAHKSVPKPGIKPAPYGETTLASAKGASMKHLKFDPKTFEQGDIDLQTSQRFDTGFMALNAHKQFVDKRYNVTPTGLKPTVKSLGTVTKKKDFNSQNPLPTSNKVKNVWGVQIGAFNSRIATETAVKTAKRLLPDDLRYARNTISPLVGAGRQYIYRARLTGYTKTDAQKVCTYFQDCMILSPTAQ